jgi:hypothetical protein
LPAIDRASRKKFIKRHHRCTISDRFANDVMLACEESGGLMPLLSGGKTAAGRESIGLD